MALAFDCLTPSENLALRMSCSTPTNARRETGVLGTPSAETKIKTHKNPLKHIYKWIKRVKTSKDYVQVCVCGKSEIKHVSLSEFITLTTKTYQNTKENQ